MIPSPTKVLVLPEQAMTINSVGHDHELCHYTDDVTNTRYRFYPNMPESGVIDSGYPWYPCKGGWEYHLASAVGEWGMAFTFLAFFWTFKTEFRSVRWHGNVSMLQVPMPTREPLLVDGYALLHPQPVEVGPVRGGGASVHPLPPLRRVSHGGVTSV
jgi:hypothetical protein